MTKVNRKNRNQTKSDTFPMDTVKPVIIYFTVKKIESISVQM